MPTTAPMHLTFLREAFLEYPIEFRRDGSQEWARIQHPDHDHAIQICFDPGTPDPYYLVFATQHLHIEDADELIESIRDFASGKYAAIEFYRNGESRFGGQIETALLDGVTYGELRKLFGASSLFFRWLTFRVTAWDRRYCFEGCFRRGKSGQMEIVRKT